MTLQSPIPNESQEEAAIRKLEAALVDAWNRHDAKASLIGSQRMKMW
jgi:hypothetical protein